jgi:hypothetical protein
VRPEARGCEVTDPVERVRATSLGADADYAITAGIARLRNLWQRRMVGRAVGAVKHT